MPTIQDIKQRFGIIGSAPDLERSIAKAMRVAPTDISVMVSGESGTGKEVIPKIIHQLSARKHASYIAVNCGAIPEGTIDSELFGHEKGSFTGATANRKGYFEVADGGTIFLDEVGELPLATQVRLLRVLETGEFIKVGSSKTQKTDVRIVAATNVNLQEAIQKNKFREDLFYRLNTVQVNLPPLRARKNDIHLIFRKFAMDFAEKYHMPSVRLTEDAIELMNTYHWPGNIRQLRNVTEQVSVVEESRLLEAASLKIYLPENNLKTLPVLYDDAKGGGNDFTEREILYKVLFDMKKDIGELKKLTKKLMKGEVNFDNEMTHLERKVFNNYEDQDNGQPILLQKPGEHFTETQAPRTQEIIPQESLSLQDKEIEMIKNALEKHKGKRKGAASELGISERTLYRKIKQFEL
ncbi:sigma-54 dependent transcriptional regulator [Flavobacteriales bacterium]|nr:sigma-54 dependent transcriptional regulator [Flavobacteriales bacterium]MDG1145561.1 sigma-54 dependent transcriptional regulator [Flavobacteriales bacterium]MDG1395827.1 sigma-54 dependent transcriptional regulator [Flavobacteriales bacterium]